MSNGKILECSTRGCALGKKFSAFNAMVTILGETKTVEKHYQEAKRFNGEQLDMRSAKGKKPDGFVFRDDFYDASLLTGFYYFLWIGFYIENRDLLEKANKYDDFKDMFKGKSVNCQADTLRLYLRDKKKYLEIVKPFQEEVNKRINA